MLKLVVIYLLNKLALCYIKVSYALKLLRENILWLIMKILDIDLNVTNINVCKSTGNYLLILLIPLIPKLGTT